MIFIGPTVKTLNVLLQCQGIARFLYNDRALCRQQTALPRWSSSKGANKEPCGTPDVIGKGVDVAPWTVTCWHPQDE